MESWQSGNAPDSKSGEPVRNRRAGSNPVLSFKVFLFAFEIEMKLQTGWSKIPPRLKLSTPSKS